MQLRSQLSWAFAALLLMWCVGMFGRGYWTPDEPREADIAWRMSLTYWLAAIPIKFIGSQAWAARLPNLLYAIITALGVGLLAARSAGRFAGLVGAATVSTFLLSYQVAIWLATDAPLVAAVSIALLGAYIGFYAVNRSQRLRGYLLMHVALALGFLCKSAVAWMVPALALLTLSIWERRWRELFRWELYVGLMLQAALILSWVWVVYTGAEGVEHLKVFFWNNLVGRFTAVNAPAEFQYAAAHRNSPGKYLLELPMYLLPWTLLVIAAARRAWRQRRTSVYDNRAVRFALAASLPPLLVLSLAATARNIYLAPALPGVGLLVAWWAREILPGPDRWDIRALRATAAIILAAVMLFIAALWLIGHDAWDSVGSHTAFIAISVAGLAVATLFAIRAWVAAHNQVVDAQWALLLAYCALLIGPASQIYRQVDRWQDLANVGRAIQHDSAGKSLILLAPDETTRAIIDMYARTSVRVSEPAAITEGTATSVIDPANSLFLVQLPKAPLTVLPRFDRARPASEQLPDWMSAAKLRVWKIYSVRNGRRYALLQSTAPRAND
jgi:4-amino-4-deoxy-L-arabinose transferase-like glycosyltransferase